jgi:hypothetical protein
MSEELSLWYFKPDGHGPFSFFTIAATARDACAAINAARAEALKRGESSYCWGEHAFSRGQLKRARRGEVIENNND